MMEKHYSWSEVIKSSKSRDGLLSIYIYRKFSYIFTYIFVNFVKLSPNQVTFLGFICWIFSAILILWGYKLLPAVLIFLGFVIDCTDGNVARLTNRSSFKGKMIDFIVDRISFLTILWSLTISLFIESYNIATILLGILYTVLGSLTDAVRDQIEKKTFSDIHGVRCIEKYEIKFKKILKNIFIFIDENNIVLGVGADLLWTGLLFSTLFRNIFAYIISTFIVMKLLEFIIYLHIISNMEEIE